MGMDYKYAGSASYPRFNDEVEGIAKLFGAQTITNRKPQEECTMLEYFMEDPLEYKFPDGTPDILVKWANDPYNENFTKGETKELYDILKTKWDEVKRISNQIAYELETCVACYEAWDIC